MAAAQLLGHVACLQAFDEMDKNGDETLSYQEVLRAFRLSPVVRDILLPLLPMPSAEKNSLTGVNIQAQVGQKIQHQPTPSDPTHVRPTPRITLWSLVTDC